MRQDGKTFPYYSIERVLTLQTDHRYGESVNQYNKVLHYTYMCSLTLSLLGVWTSHFFVVPLQRI